MNHIEDGIEAVENYIKNVEAITIEKLEKKQDTLVSGENIKTINGVSVLGEGNIEAVGDRRRLPEAGAQHRSVSGDGGSQRTGGVHFSDVWKNGSVRRRNEPDSSVPRRWGRKEDLSIRSRLAGGRS